jgi:hypothetical protein
MRPTHIFFAALALACAAPALAEQEKPKPVVSPYTVIEADTDIPFARTRVSGFTVGADHSLILQVGAGRFYRATLNDFCARDLKWEHRIAIDYDASGRFDRFSKVFVDGRRCLVQSVDRIENPRATKKKDAAAEASGEAPQI